MNKGKTYYQLIPKKAYQNLSVIEDLIRSEIKGFSSDNLKEVISIIACHVRKDEGGTPLKMDYIKKLVPQGHQYLKNLIDIEIIKRSGFAKKGISSYKYLFVSEYESKFVRLPLTNAKLIRRIREVYDKQNKEASRAIRGYNEQVRFLKMLSIDESFKEYLNDNYSIETDQYNFILGSATRIANEDIFIPLIRPQAGFIAMLRTWQGDSGLS